MGGVVFRRVGLLPPNLLEEGVFGALDARTQRRAADPAPAVADGQQHGTANDQVNQHRQPLQRAR